MYLEFTQHIMSLVFNTDLYMCISAGAEIYSVHVCVHVTVQNVIYTVHLYMHKVSSFTNAAIRVTTYICIYCMWYCICTVVKSTLYVCSYVRSTIHSHGKYPESLPHIPLLSGTNL